MTTLDWLKHRKGEAVLEECETSQLAAAPDPTAVLPEKSPRIPEDSIFDDLQTNIFSGTEKIIDHSTGRIGPLGDSRGFIEVSRAENEITQGNIGDSHSDSEISRGFVEDSASGTQQKPDLIDKSAPHLLADGTLVIPFNSDPKYHWWKGGQSIAQTRAEVLAAKKEENDGTSI